jgi:hypothetical protein
LPGHTARASPSLDLFTLLEDRDAGPVDALLIGFAIAVTAASVGKDTLFIDAHEPIRAL